MFLGIRISVSAMLKSGAFSPASLFALSEPGVWYDPSDVANLDWRRNLLERTEEFDNVYWTKAGISVSANTQNSPTGVSTADVITATAGNGEKYLLRGVTTTGQSTLSVYAKAGTHSFIQLTHLNAGYVANFDLSTGQVGTVAANTTAQIQSVGSGWYRCTATFSGAVAYGATIRVYMIPSATSGYGALLNATGSETVLIWGAQLELGSTVTEYQRITDVNTEVRERFPNNTLFQDTAGTTPVTTAGQTVARINDKSGRGNHATQATAASRPTYGVVPQGGRRNLLTYSEQFDNAAWAKTNATVTANAGTAPDGTTTADKIVGSLSANAAREVSQAISKSASAISYTASAYLKASDTNFAVLSVFDGGSVFNRQWFDLQNGTAGATAVGGGGFTSVSASIVSVGDGWWRCSVSFTSNTTTSISAFFAATTANAILAPANGVAAGAFIWGAQLETGSTATAYQRVGNAFDVTEAGVPSLHYLSFDGVDDFLVTPTITPNIDKAQVFAGVRKLSSASFPVIVEHSASTSSNAGSFNMLACGTADGTAGWLFASKGTTAANAAVNSGYAAPITSVVVGLGDISGDLSTLRANGAQIAQATNDQGTGNYLAYPLYIGRRGGTSLPFNGQLYSMIVRFGANLDAGTISNTERWIGGKTGVSI